VEIVHSTSPAPAARRARVAGGAEEPLSARRIRSSKRRRQDASAAPRRRRTRAIPAALPSPARAIVLARANAALSELVHSTSQAPAAPRARVAGGAEEPLFARRIRSSKRGLEDSCLHQPKRFLGSVRTKCSPHPAGPCRVCPSPMGHVGRSGVASARVDDREGRPPWRRTRRLFVQST
jgi:hypothetical protein